VRLLGEFFPVANRIIGYVADGTSCEPEFFAGGCLALDELLDRTQRVADVFFVFFACFFVAG
jgi:hypothetical protein